MKKVKLINMDFSACMSLCFPLMAALIWNLKAPFWNSPAWCHCHGWCCRWFCDRGHPQRRAPNWPSPHCGWPLGTVHSLVVGEGLQEGRKEGMVNMREKKANYEDVDYSCGDGREDGGIDEKERGKKWMEGRMVEKGRGKEKWREKGKKDWL